jgi:eukaryotic-like serine/threonine-protein kinase
MADEAPPSERTVGRYVMCDEIAAGGMATVHIGRLQGPVGFARTVAIKRLHAHFAKDPEFVTMLLDEARLAARIRHPNVVSTLDVVVEKGELLVVMDYVQGESLSKLSRTASARKEPVSLGVAMSVAAGALYGLHAAHEAKTEQGAPLGVIHRDVSPQNIMVGVDGVTRVLDFGVARAAGRMQTTREGTLKGKLAYMSPEQVRGDAIDRRSDVYSMAVVLWELVVGRRLYVSDSEAELLNKVLTMEVPPPSRVLPGLPPRLDALVMKGLRHDRGERFASALEMAEAAQKIAFATPGEVGAWVTALGGEAIADRSDRIARIESKPTPGDAVIPVTKLPVGDPKVPAPRTRAASATVLAQIAKDAVTRPGSGPLPPPDPLSPASQVSQLSVTRSVPRSVPLGIGLAVLGGSLFVGALVIAVLALRLRAASTPAATATEDHSPSAAVAAPALPAVDMPVDPAAVDAGTLPPAIELNPPSASPQPASPASPASPSSPSPRTVRRPPAPRTQTQTQRCKPPYSIDANGIRSPKPECM